MTSKPPAGQPWMTSSASSTPGHWAGAPRAGKRQQRRATDSQPQAKKSQGKRRSGEAGKDKRSPGQNRRRSHALANQTHLFCGDVERSGRAAGSSSRRCRTLARTGASKPWMPGASRAAARAESSSSSKGGALSVPPNSMRSQGWSARPCGCCGAAGSPGDGSFGCGVSVLRQAAGRVRRRFLPPGDVPQRSSGAFFCRCSSVPQLLQKVEPARLAVPQCGQRTVRHGIARDRLAAIVLLMIISS